MENEYILDELKSSRKGKPIKYIITEKGCWDCINYNKNNSGYPWIRVNNKNNGMHRYVWEIYNNKKIPNKMVIMHICDNRCCINPSHLKLGTYKDNREDMINKGRENILRGKKHPKYDKEDSEITRKNKSNSAKKRAEKTRREKIKLNEVQLLEIKQRIINREKLIEISKDYPISISTLSFIKNGKSTYTNFLKGGLKEWLEE